MRPPSLLHRHWCDDCLKTWKAENRTVAPTKNPARRIPARKKSGLTSKQFKFMLVCQEGKCAVCMATMTNPVIDHNKGCCKGNHSCGKCVRGLVCRPCADALTGYEYFKRIGRLVATESYLDTYQDGF